ncbi:hypothetical protein [Caballeronia telluris]|uniref:hypothetical protein n=1 Tax=Caballeronia telluris TaxID=326475 RepID=UPI000F746AF2|nr:hypothetical protein [Caballeronia telluris]
MNRFSKNVGLNKSGTIAVALADTVALSPVRIPDQAQAALRDMTRAREGSGANRKTGCKVLY